MLNEEGEIPKGVFVVNLHVVIVCFVDKHSTYYTVHVIIENR